MMPAVRPGAGRATRHRASNRAWHAFLARPGARLGLVALALLAAVALCADLLASDLPLAVRLDGATHVLPCLLQPAALRDSDQQSLDGDARVEWTLHTPVRHGPFGIGSDRSTPIAPKDTGRSPRAALPLAAPSWDHPAGTDSAGRDVAARLIHGTRTALAVGGVATLLFVLTGLLVGAACAAGRAADLVLGRLIEIGSVVPAYFLLLAVQAAAVARGEGASLLEVSIAIALTRWPEVARVTRAEALRVAVSPHIEAARAIGLSPLAIALRHVLPLAAGPALVAGAVGVGQAVLLEAGLSFLGFGVAPPLPSWGGLLAEAHAAGMPPHLVLLPALCIALLVLATGRVADGLSAVVDPRHGQR